MTTLTDFQVDILKHRLETTDAIAQCLAETALDDHNDESLPEWSEDEYDRVYGEYFDRCEHWLRYFENCSTLPDSSLLSEQDKHVLANAVNCSVFVASCRMDDEYYPNGPGKPASRSTLNRHIASGRALAKMVTELTGIECVFPVE